MFKKFNLDQKVVIITGCASLMAVGHKEAVTDIGGIPIPFDIDENINMIVIIKVLDKILKI